MSTREEPLGELFRWPVLAFGGTPSRPPLRVLVAEGLPLLRALLRDLLTAQPQITVVGEVRTAGDLLVQTRQLAPDVVLLDWVLGGLDMLQALRALDPAPAVIVLLAGADPEYCAVVLAHGGAACLPREHLHRALPPALLEIIGDGGKGATHGRP